MGFSNRSLTRRGSTRRLRAIRARDYWTWRTTVFVIALLSTTLLDPQADFPKF
jgi:hypothetical protein